MRWAIALMLTGCMSNRLVAREELVPLRGGKVGDGLVVKTMAQWKSRIDPRSSIRFFNKHHESTDWLDGDTVHVTKDWIYTPGVVGLLEHTESITIRGLEKGELDDLAVARPLLGTSLEITEDGIALVQARGKILDEWVNKFIDEVAVRNAPKEDDFCVDDLTQVGGKLCYSTRDALGKRVHLRRFHDCVPLGRWTVHLARQGAIALKGTAIFDHLELGFPAQHGWRWNEVAYAEVEDLSGAKTLGGVIGGTVLVAAAVALGVRRMDIDYGVKHLPGTWQGTLADDEGKKAPLLFGEGARRRAEVQVVAIAEVGVDTFGATQFWDGGTAMVRMFQAFDLGVGGSHLTVRQGTKLWHAGLAYARIGGHFPIDAAHRYAIPFTFDLGGGGGEPLGSFFRMRTGLQRRLGDHAFAGFTLTPTYIHWQPDKAPLGAKSWTLATGFEAGVTF